MCVISLHFHFVLHLQFRRKSRNHDKTGQFAKALFKKPEFHLSSFMALFKIV
jgi:hypothetical protein